MSAADDIITNKDEDDMLSDSVHLNPVRSSDDNTSKYSSKEVSCIDSIINSKAETTTEKGLDSNMESGDDAAGILGKNETITTDDSTSKSILTCGGGKGDSKHTGSITEVDKVEVGKPELTEGDEGIKVVKETEKVDADDFEDDDLELKWEDDDCNIESPNDHVEERDTTASVECSSQIDKIELKNDDNKVESLFDEKNTEELKKNINSAKLEENNTAKDAEMDLEEKLLEETVAPTDSSVTPADEIPMEINEDELLRDDQPQDVETMDVDLSTEKETAAQVIDEIPDSTDNQTNTKTNIIDKTNNTEEIDEVIDPKTPNNNQLKENDEVINTKTPELKENDDEITLEKDNNIKNSTLNDNIDDNNDDSQELNLSMEVDQVDVSVDSPGPLKTIHRLLKPDVMLEIPTQELIDFDDVLDSPNCSKLDDSIINDDLTDEHIDNGTKIDEAISNDDTIGAGRTNDDNNGKGIKDAIANDDSIDDAKKNYDTVANEEIKNENIAMDAKNDRDNAIDEQIDSVIANNDVIDKSKEAVATEDMVIKSKVQLEVDDEKNDENVVIKSKVKLEVHDGKNYENLAKEQIAVKAVIDDAQPSTSASTLRMIPDTSDEVSEMTDSLGLLAESCRTMGRDDDDDDEEGDVDDDDDFDDGESSNQMTGDHSEDSNAPHSETEPIKCQQEKEITEDVEETEMEITEDVEEPEMEITEDVEETEMEIREEEENAMMNKCDEEFECEDNIDTDEEDNNMPIIANVCTSGKKTADDNNVNKKPLQPETKIAEPDVKIKTEENIPKTTDTVKLERNNAIEPTATKEKESTTEPTAKKEKESTTESTAEKEKESTTEPTAKKKMESTTEEIVIKKEKHEANVTKVLLKKDRAKAVYVVSKDDDNSQCSVDSSDDVIEQIIEIETVKVSDDEDDITPTPKAEEDLPVQKNDSTVNTEVNTSVKKEIDVPEVIASTEKMETAKEVSKDTAMLKGTAKDASPKDASPKDASPKNGSPKDASPKDGSAKDASPKDASPNDGSAKDANPKGASPKDASAKDASPKDVESTKVSQPTTDSNKQSPKTSPSKIKNLRLSSMVNSQFLSIVELGESSSEEETEKEPPEHTISQLQKLLQSPSPEMTTSTLKDVTTVNIPTGIEIMSTSASGGKSSEIVTKEGEVVISGVAKPPPLKTARLNTSEVTIKTASNSEQTLVIPEAKINETDLPPIKGKTKFTLEIFSLDSDEEDATSKEEAQKPTKKTKKCVNSSCPGGFKTLSLADVSTAAYYDASKKKRPLVCDICADIVTQRQQKLIAGIRNMTPLLQLEIPSIAQDLVEILDSESEDEDTTQDQPPKETIGEETAKFLEENLADLLNDTWKKHNLDERLKETKDELNAKIQKLEEETEDINQMLVNCQLITDKLRHDLYATFEHRIQELPSFLIYETPDLNYIGPEADQQAPTSTAESRLSAKRKMLTQNETPAKRPAIPLGYAPLDDSKSKAQEQKPVDNKNDDDKDISVVKLSAESAPADLPPPGEMSRPPIRVGMPVYAMKNAFGPWLKGKIMEVFPKSANPAAFTSCRVKFDHKEKINGKILQARCIAYAEPSSVRMTIGTRLIALFKDANKGESYYSGVVAEIPNPVNKYRYLVFFDDGYAQYVKHPFTRLVCESSSLVWEEVHPFSREFVREYLMAYPERPMVRLHQGQHLKTEWDGKWWSSKVIKVDASLAQVVFIGDGRREWIYRGSTRLAPLYLELRAAERHRPRPMPRSTQPRSNMMPYVEYTRSDEQAAKTQEARPAPVTTPLSAQQQNEEIRRLRAVARKSTSMPPAAAPPPPPVQAPTAGNLDSVTSRVVYYTPKNAVRPYKLTPHKCSPKCKRKDVLTLKELRTYNPLAKPLLSGWERQIVRYKGQKEVMYRAPCGRRLRNMSELHRYLRMTESDLPVDLFDFYHATHCLAEFVLNKCLVGKKDLSHGKENVPVPCVNYYDESLPEFCSYNTERTPTSGVPLNLDPEFLCGCDCTDDCEDKSKCACWKMTLEGAHTIGLEGTNIGYEYKRLPEPLPSGIYECNSRCKCKETCLNRVAQHPLQLKLQVFKTLNRGWGIRALNDVPKGSFLCVYAGNLLTDATANLDGLNEGDEYLAELDYIEVVEQMKEGYEEDIPDADKKLDKEGTKQDDTEEETTSSEEDELASKDDIEDDDFEPGFYMGPSDAEFKKSLRKRKKKEQKNAEAEAKEKDNKSANPVGGEDCITISDDEEIREPSSFSAKPGMGGSDFISKYRSVRKLFGEDEACYIMDAKVQGNIGRYLNHSCSPNVFVQNVFVDTHDPRFPWVAFFALSHIKAGTELTWNYNYDVGSVPGKTLYCYCEAPNCRGRLL